MSCDLWLANFCLGARSAKLRFATTKQSFPELHSQTESL